MVTVNSKKSFLIYILAALAVVILLNLVARHWFFRLDFTDTKMYSLSDSSKNVVRQVDDLLTMKIYFSSNLPGEYGNTRRYLQDILEEYQAYSSGNIKFEFYQPNDDSKLEEEAQKYGIQPVQLQVIENDKLEIKKVYMGMVFIFEDQRETIPVIQTTTGLEYEITTNIKKLVDEDKKTVGIASLGSEVGTENIGGVLQQAYNVMPVDLTQTIGANIDVLLVSGTTDTLDVTVANNLRSFIARGGNMLLAQNRISADIQAQTAAPIQSDIFSLLDQYGLHLKENLVLDRRCGQVTVTQQIGFLRMNNPVDYPFFPLIQNFSDHVTVNGLEQVRMLFASEIDIPVTAVADTVAGVQPLFITSDNSTTVEQFFNLHPTENPAFKSLNEPGKVVAALSTIVDDTTHIASQLVLVADNLFLADEGAGRIPENIIFVMNAVDYLMGDSELVALRSREITTRPLKELEDSTRARWKWANILLPSLLVIGFGIVRWNREKSRAKMLEEMYE